MKDHSFNQLLHNRNFVKLWASQMLSQFTIQIMTFFVLTMIYSLTKSTIAVSLMWVAGSLPALLFGPFAGALVDNFSRRKLLVTTQVLQAFVILLLLFTGHKVFYLYTIVFLYWFLDQLYYPSQQATAPELVAKESLPFVNGLFLLTQQASIVVGFGLGGILISTVGKQPTIVLASINLLLAAACAFFLPHDRAKGKLVENGIAEYFKDLLAGYNFVKTHPAVLIPLLTVAFSQIFVTIVATSIPSYTQEVLKFNIYKASTLLIVPAALGALSLTLIIPHLLKRFRKSVLIRTGMLLGGLSLISLWLISFLTDFRQLFSVVIAFALGVSLTLIMVPAQSLLQSQTPDEMRGRVFGQLGFLLILATMLPLIASAAVADLLGVAMLFALLGLILVLGYLFIRFKHGLANSFGI